MLYVLKLTPLWMDSFLGLKSSSSTSTLYDKNLIEKLILFLPWVESPELALAVVKAEGSAPSHVSNLDALPRVQVVPGVLGLLLD